MCSARSLFFRPIWTVRDIQTYCSAYDWNQEFALISKSNFFLQEQERILSCGESSYFKYKIIFEKLNKPLSF